KVRFIGGSPLRYENERAAGESTSIFSGVQPARGFSLAGTRSAGSRSGGAEAPRGLKPTLRTFCHEALRVYGAFGRFLMLEQQIQIPAGGQELFGASSDRIDIRFGVVGFTQAVVDEICRNYFGNFQLFRFRYT